MREAVVSGTFYEQDKESLKKQIEECFKSSFGAGMDSFKLKETQKIFSIIVPHAGYFYSGPCASHAYAELMKLDKGKEMIFIILGTDHTGRTNSNFSVSLEDFETPLGIVSNHKGFSQLLVDKKILEDDENAHTHEHSIEVQLPFLQYCVKKFKIVPIVCSSQSYSDLRNFAESISKLMEKQGKENGARFVVIASSDFTHYGPSYNYVPFSLNKGAKNNLYSLDNEIIQSILKLNSKSFFEKASKSTVCGKAPITVAVEISKLLGAKTAKLLKYYTSGDIVGDYENSVGYASIVIK